MLQQALTPAGSHFSPLEKLNDDCLLLIFQEVRPQITFIANTSPREVRSCNIALLELRRVCKGWKELVESRPELWSTIFVFTRSLRSINSALVYLHRSRQTPLYLYVFGGLSDTPSDETGIAKNFKRGLQVAATRVIHTGGKDQNTQWVHGEFIVSSETIRPPHTQWVHGEFF